MCCESARAKIHSIYEELKQKSKSVRFMPMEDVIEIVGKVEESLKRTEEEAMRFIEKMNNRWIPVSEKLPKGSSMVLVTWVNKCLKDTPFTNVATYYNGKWYWYDGTAFNRGGRVKTTIFECDEKVAMSENDEVIAWIPLPDSCKIGD